MQILGIISPLIISFLGLVKPVQTYMYSGGMRPGPAMAHTLAGKACAPADEVGQNEERKA